MIPVEISARVTATYNLARASPDNSEFVSLIHFSIGFVG